MKKISAKLKAPSTPNYSGEFSPQLHFTGECNDGEINLINKLLKKYGDGLVAHYIYYPFPGMYSVELQFGENAEQDKLRSECRREYLESFDDDGVLIK